LLFWWGGGRSGVTGATIFGLFVGILLFGQTGEEQKLISFAIAAFAIAVGTKMWGHVTEWVMLPRLCRFHLYI